MIRNQRKRKVIISTCWNLETRQFPYELIVLSNMMMRSEHKGFNMVLFDVSTALEADDERF